MERPVLSDDETACLDVSRTNFANRLNPSARPPAFATNPSASFWQAVLNVSPVSFQVSFPIISAVQRVDISFNNPISSGALPLAVGVQISNDGSNWQDLLYFAQNCATFNARNMTVPCTTTASSRFLSASTSAFARFIRLTMTPSSTTRPIEVCCS